MHTGESVVINERVRLEGFVWQTSGLASFNGDQTDALRASILTLWFEAAGCYDSGLFEACILTCGAIVERCLKLEYERSTGSQPKGRWTLARCAYELDWDGVVSPDVVNLAKKLVSPHNGRAHALLEHTDPHLAMLCEPLLDEPTSGAHSSLIETYRSEAREVLEITFRILLLLYETPMA